MTDFYTKYVALCANKKKSLSSVAEEIGLSRTSPNGWKKGKIPNDVNIQKLADYFGVSFDYLKGTQESENPATVRDEVKKAVSNYDLLNDENKAIIDQMIEKLIKSQSGD